MAAGPGTARAAYVMYAMSLLLTGVSCGRTKRATTETRAAVAPITIELGGCAAVLAGPICEVNEGSSELRIWAGPTATGVADLPSLRAALGDDALPSTSEDVDGGRRFRFTLPADVAAGPAQDGGGARDLAVTITLGDARRVVRVPIRRAASHEALERAQRLRKEGRFDAAAEAMPSTEELPPSLRGRAESLRARIDLASGRVEEAVARLQRSRETHRIEARVSDEALDAMALSHTLLTHGGRVAEARRALDSAAPAFAQWDEGRAQVGYYRALIARDSGDLRLAMRELRATARAAERMGLDDFLRRVRQISARLLETMGETRQARVELRAIEAALPAHASACDRAELMTNLGWIELTSLEAQRQSPQESAATLPSLVTRLEETLVLWERGCPKPAEIANARTNLALAALASGRVDAAAAHAARARELGALPGVVAAWLLDIEARVALARGEPRLATKLYEELGARGQATSQLEAVWRSNVGRGLALEATRDFRGAERAYREAEAIVEEQASRVSLNEGRAGFLAGGDRSGRLLADLLVARGRSGEALDVVRAGRVRALRAAQRLDRVSMLSGEARARWEEALSRYVEARSRIEAAAANDWAVPRDRVSSIGAPRRLDEQAARRALDDAFAALAEKRGGHAAFRSPAAGELLIAFQITADGAALRAYARSAMNITSTTIALRPEVGSDETAGHVLVAFSSEIERASKVRILTGGPLDGVDFHGLTWRGAPLLAHVAVEYPLDLPLPDGAAPAEGLSADRRGPSSRSALVVADAREDLPEARRESSEIGSRLSGTFTPTVLVGTAALRDAVMGGLARSDLFHFASHASFDPRGAWESALELAGGGWLRLGDVLTLPRVPDLVVLSGCETGRSPSARVADLSLAHAFLASGSSTVVATARPVADRLAAAMIEHLYKEVTLEGWDLAVALRAAQLSLAQQTPPLDWSAYRVFSR